MRKVEGRDPWVFNPISNVELFYERGGLASARLVTAVKGVGVRCNWIEAEECPELVPWLESIGGGAAPLATGITERAWLRLVATGLVVLPSDCPKKVHLQRELASQSVLDDPFMVRQLIDILSTGALVVGRNWSLREPADLLISEPLTGVQAALSLTAEEFQGCAALTPGSSPPPWLSLSMKRAFVAIGVLRDSERDARTAFAWARSEAAAREQVKVRLYGQLPSLLPAHLVARLRLYFREKIAEGLLEFCDDETRRFRSHNDPALVDLHARLARVLSGVFEMALKPSYSMFAGYEPGAMLAPHTDRAQCEFSTSVLLGFYPDPPDESPWPLLVESDCGMAEVRQRPGDAIVYRGRVLRHSRPVLPAGCRSHSVFFHFVSPDFEGSLD